MLLLIAGCDSKTPERDGQSVAKAQPHPTQATRTASQDADLALAREFAGSTWVAKDAPPSGSVEDNCAADAGLSVDEGGGYAGLYESGSWTVQDRQLIVTVMQSNDDTGGEGPERPLRPPRVYRWTIDSIADDIATLHDRDAKSWMFRCS